MSIQLVTLLVISMVNAQNNTSFFELSIIHFNDFHAHFDEILPNGAPCNPTIGDCIGGFSRLYSAIRQAMEDDPDSLLLNGGDTFQGTIWYNFLRWNVSQHFMNMLPHDAHLRWVQYISLSFDEILPNGAPCNPTIGDCIGGFSRLYSAIRQAMEDDPDSLLLNGGDTFQGTIWYNFLRWNVSQHFMNMLPHDAHVLGNHEFDNGIEGLVPYLERLKTPMLGANVNTTFEPEIAPYVKNHVVVQRNERKIGIIGVLLRTFSAPSRRIIMEDELEAINREADILTEQGVDIIIVLSHMGYYTDMCAKSLAERMSPNVDIIVGGHTHTLLYTGETPDGSQPAGDYPTVVTQAKGHKIPIVQAAAHTRYLGNIKLFIDEAGKVVSWQGQPIYLGTSIVKDPYVESQLEPWRRAVDAVGKEVLGRTLVPLRADCNRGECNMGSWACDGLIDEMVSQNRKNLVTLGVDYEMLQQYMRRHRTFFKDLDGRIQIVY